jgi:hypothetical protein
MSLLLAMAGLYDDDTRVLQSHKVGNPIVTTIGEQ